MSDFEFERRNIGDGWQSIIWRLHLDLEEIIPGYGVRQIKEKMGGLRYYITVPPNVTEDAFHRAYARINEAEQEAWRTCEVCGRPGTTRGGWWLKTLCEEHETERQEKRRSERQRQ